MSETQRSAGEDGVRALVRRAQMYVKDGTVRAVVLERLAALHGLAHAEVLRAEQELRAVGVRVDRRPEAVVVEAVPVAEEAYERRAEVVDHRAACAAARALLREARRLRNPSRRILTAEEEVGLAVLVRSGTPLGVEDELPEFFRAGLDPASEAARAFDALVVHNVRLVWSIAIRMAGQAQSLDPEDLVGYGNLGLIRAVQKFDASKGYKLSTYATWWIRQAVGRAIADYDRAIRIPVHMVEKINRTRSAYTRIVNRGGRPSLPALAAEAGFTLDEVRAHLDLMRGTFSLDAPVDGAGELYLHEILTAEDETSDPAADFAGAGLRQALAAALAQLPDREASVVRMRFGLDGAEPRTLEEIGNEFGLTRERIRQIEAKAMLKLRHPSRTADLRVFLFAADVPDPVLRALRLAEHIWRLQGDELQEQFRAVVPSTAQETVRGAPGGGDELKRLAVAFAGVIAPQQSGAVLTRPLACIGGRTLVEVVRPGVDVRVLFGRVLRELHGTPKQQSMEARGAAQELRARRGNGPPHLPDAEFEREKARSLQLLAEVRAHAKGRAAPTSVDKRPAPLREPKAPAHRSVVPHKEPFPAARAAALMTFAEQIRHLAPSERVLALVHWGHVVSDGPAFNERDIRDAFALAWGTDEPIFEAVTRAADSGWIHYDPPSGRWHPTRLGQNLVAAARLQAAVATVRGPTEGVERHDLADRRAALYRLAAQPETLPQLAPGAANLPRAAAAPVRTGSGDGGSVWAPPPAFGSAAGDRGDTPTAEEFLRQKQPQTAQERALCLLYWATVVRNSSTTHTTYVDDLNRRTAGRPFSDAGATLQGVMRSAELAVRRGHGMWELTARGRRLVEVMPDRAQVASLRAGW